MKLTSLLALVIAAFGLIATSCTSYDSARQGEDDYEAAIERKAREKQMQETQQARSDSAQARSIQR